MMIAMCTVSVVYAGLFSYIVYRYVASPMENTSQEGTDTGLKFGDTNHCP
jgi:hypothetical protein